MNMDFADRLRAEHDEFKKMLFQLSDSGIEDVDLRGETYADLLMRVDAHERAEEQTIYEALKQNEDTKELALEGIEQHRIARVLMVELRKVSLDDELWLPKLRAIKTLLENHIMVEEGLVIPTAKDVFDQGTMDRFDQEFERKEKENLRTLKSGPAII
jgi:hemerythrin-like domain-containing protein